MADKFFFWGFQPHAPQCGAYKFGFAKLAVVCSIGGYSPPGPSLSGLPAPHPGHISFGIKRNMEKKNARGFAPVNPLFACFP